MKMGRRVTFCMKLLAILAAVALWGTALPVAATASEADLLPRIEALQKEIDALKAQVKKVQDTAKAPATAEDPVQRTEVNSWRKYFSAVPTGEAPATSARTGITVYGRVDLGYEYNDDGKTSRGVLNNYASRIGFKGTRELGDNLTGLLQIETGIAPDDNANSGTWASRESYIGLRHRLFGTIKAGRHDSPFKDLEGVGSPMFGSDEAMEVIIHGKGTSRAAGATWANFHTRFNNTIQYETPRFFDIEGRFAYSTDEVNPVAGTERKPAYAGSLEWNNGMFNAGVAYQATKNYNGASKEMSGIKLSAGVKWDPFTFGLLWSRLGNDLGKTTNNWMAAATYNLGPVILKANYGESSETATNAADGLKMIGVEAGYPLDKHTTLYAYYAKIMNDRNARGRFEAGDNTYTPVAGDDPSVTSLALRYNF
ncbi:MAG: porin [Deltaproteobacteria bacterium]|nr:porin [Deltaproteobacteria bacterium]